MKRTLISGRNTFAADGSVNSNVYDLGADPEKRGVVSIVLNTQPAGASAPTGSTVAHNAKLQTREKDTDAWIDVTGEVTPNITVHTNKGSIRDVAVTVGLLRFVRLVVTASITGTPAYNDGVLADFALIAARV